MIVRRLPSPLETIRVPKYFAPSRFAELAHCPLRVFVNADNVVDALPPTPRVLLGLVLHHVREELLMGRWGSAPSPTKAFEEVFEATIDSIELQIAADARCSRMLPLAHTIGRVTWNTRRFEMEKWAARIRVATNGESPRPLSSVTRPGAQCATNAQRDDGTFPRFDVGPEAWIVCPALRIRGRADLVEEAMDGALEISDYKSGLSCDDQGRPLERHLLQLGLYALAAESLAPDRPVRLFIDGADRLPVAWNRNTRRFYASELSKADDRFPAEAPRCALELGRPGTCCIGCRIRPVCPSYLDAASRWWPNREGAPRPLPIDTWGTVLALRRDEGSVTVDMEDRAGRRVRVEGLDPGRALGHLRLGDDLYLFDLEPTEPTILHGARLHPRNFHELPPDGGLRFKRARALQVYRA